MKLTKKVLAADKVKKENRELREAVKKRTYELEQKNRDLEIEASLEKVRARAMAMQSSSELADLIGMIYTELTRLDINLDRCFIMLFDEPTGDSFWWMGSGETPSLKRGYHVPFHKHRPHLAFLKGWKNQESTWKYVLKGDVKKKWDEFIFSKTELAELPKVVIKNMKVWKLAHLSASFNRYGCITSGTFAPLETTSLNLLVRFSKMFEQTYTRFLDLKKAEAQTREAQIELSLERVRARAMAMQSSTELGALIGMIYTELARLDANLNRCFIVMFDDSGNATWWMGSAETTALNRGYYIPDNEHPPHLAYLNGWRNQELTWKYVLKGTVKKRWDNFIFNKTEMALVPQFIIDNMRAVPAAYLAASFNKYGCVMTATLSEITTLSFDLLIKFSRTFEQTYRRFLDLKKAEAQARESQIQLALERVRARTMAMQHSEELQDASNLLFKQVQSLDIPVWSCGFNIWEKREKICTGWMSTNDVIQPPFKVPLTESPTFIRFHKSRKNNEDFYVEKVEGKALAAHYKYMLSLPDFARIVEKRLRAGFKLPKSQINHVANFAHGNLVFISSEPVPDAWDIFKRFAKVFEQTYTRFLDLKKAEAQAREAQIEAALEKVRSTSMGMHHSDELKKVVGVLFDKLSELGLSFDAALLFVFDKPRRNIQIWIATKNLPTPINIILPYDEEIAKNPIIEDLRRGEDIINKPYSGQAKDDYFRYTVRHNESKIPEIDRKLFFELSAWTVSFAAEKNSIIAVDSWYGQTMTIENFQILKRFARVFEQAYVRFLDLQNAEAQARESQIQLALERLRARTMAMHHSSELSEAATLVFEQLSQLGVALWGCGFNICHEENVERWMSLPNGKMLDPLVIPYASDPYEKDFHDIWKRGDEMYTRAYEGEELFQGFESLKSRPSTEIIYQRLQEINIPLPNWMMHHIVPYKHGYLWIMVTKPFEETQIFVRFAKVFEQTYTRFLDLKNAEALARESQIQLALERVRARTMAMQKSDELKEVAMLLFRQVADLGITCWTTGFNVWSEDGNSYLDYVTNPLGGIMEPYTVDTTRFSVFRDVSAARKKGETFFFSLETGERQNDTYKYLQEFGDKNQFQKLLDSGFQFPTQQVNHFVFGEKVSLLFITYDHVPEAHDIFKRFGKVFEQTYTRFLDLMKAEAQAREALIEAALEKIRSRSLGMQQSDELKDVVAIVFDKLKDLGLVFDGLGIQLFTEGSKSSVIWVAAPLQISAPVLIQLPFYEHEFSDSAYITDIWSAKKAGVDLFNKTYSSDEKNRFFGYVARYNELPLSVREFHRRAPSYTATVAMEKNSALVVDNWSGKTVSTEEFNVIKRVARVFEQAYTRFLDLQKAEAQAREAKVETALEKIRSRSLAMHHSDELKSVMVIMYRNLAELKVLRGTVATVAIQLFNHKTKESTFWPINDPNEEPRMVVLPFDEAMMAADTCHRDLWQAVENGMIIFNKIYSKDQKDLWFKYVFANNDETKISIKDRELIQRSDIHTVCFVPEKKSGLFVDTWDGSCYTEEDVDVLKRAARVFEQAYTRFLDLKNAEAQTREAQIEAALEKVRARTMGMQRSDELSDAAILMFQQVRSFGFEVWGCGFNIWEKDEKECIGWMSSPEGRIVPPVKIPLTEHPLFIRFYETRQKGIEFYTYERGGKELEEFYQYLMQMPGLESLKEFVASGGHHPTFQVDHVVNFSHGNLIFITYEAYPEAHDLFKRFGKVFEQTYTRFLDLKKAEAQARESHIEAALERVRSRTMAMHKSEELLDVITVVSEQLQHVGIKFGTVSFGKNSTSFDMEFWVAAPDLKVPIKMFAPYADIPIYNRLREAYRERRNYYSDTFTAEETRVWNQHIIDHNPELFSQKSREYLTSRPGMTRSTVLLKNVFLFLINYDFVTYSNEDIEVVIRFANVFEQTYTRFLDLQKAEAQAREAQIDAALERLRSRTMAMQRSTELAEVSQLLHQQFLSLGVQTITCAFMFPDEEKKTQSGWSVLPDGTLLPHLLDFPLLGDAILDERYNSWKEKRSLHRKVLDVEENRRHHQFLSEQVATHISKDIFAQLPDQLTFTNANFAQGYLMTFTPTQLAAEEEKILVRFAKVFEQTYTRFLDLQKAEAQAREAQIEAALEKIRSRSLAMHHSGELKDVVAIMFEKMTELNVVIGTIAIQLFDQSTMNSTFWVGNNLHNEPPKVKLPYDKKVMDEDGYVKDSWESRKRSENIINKEYSFEQKTRFFDYVFANNDVATISEFDRDIIRQNVINPPNGHIVCLITEKNSSVFADSWNGQFYSGESIKVLIRAAKVFEQAYVRFLDLQKAEEQARESQIEAALERVRAKTMAMHKSEELLDVIVVVSQQLTHLGFRFDVVSFARNSEMHDYKFWFCMENAQQAHEISVPYLNNPMFERVKSAMAQGAKFHADTLTVAENREWIEHMLAHDAWPDLTDEVKNFLLNRGYARSIVFMPQIMLLLGNYFLKPYNEEQNNILKRFAAVFEQSYTRFLDLQKAEAQAREAQIEAALERVRSKAMAMHTAQQLADVVHELRTQMGFLGQKDLDTCVIHLNDESSDVIRAWAAIRPPDRDDEIREFNIDVPKRGLAIIEEAMEAYAADRKDYVLVNAGEKLERWMDFMKTALPEAFALVRGSSYDYDFQAFWSFADFQGGSLLMVTLAQPNEDSRVLLRRFANVFGLAYRRFADLKQAEAQAREATIEAALEKIRSRSLGMHKSEEILDVVVILFEKLKDLGLVFDGGAAIHLFSDESRASLLYVAAPELAGAIICDLPYDADEFTGNPIILDLWSAKEKGESIVNKRYSFEDKNRFFNYVYKHNDNSKLPIKAREVPLNAKNYTVTLIAEKNCLLGANSWTEQQFSESDVAVLKRVTRVFEQAYIRFLDLQKAEAQARESTIEAALEKIRSRSLGMHQSDELNDVIAILFEKLKELDLPFDGGAGLFLFSEGSRDTSLWVTNGRVAPVCNYLPYDESDFSHNSIMQDIWKAKDTGDPIVNKHYSSEEKNKLFSYTSKHNDEKRIPEEERKRVFEAGSYTATFIPERNSLLSVDSWSKQIMSAGDIELLKRFARVFEQAYVRFLDLQKAEVHANKAVCQASLDRVRAEIASMRTVEDLDRITPLIWRELNTIGIPFIRCGVFIMDEPNHVVHTFLSTPEGKAIAVFQLPFDVPGRLGGIVKHWLDKKIFLDYWDELAKKEVADILVGLGIFSSSQQYIDTLPKEGFYLHVLPFAQGMLYVGNLAQMKNEELNLLQSLADAFATAYARYDDFNKLESAKQQVDRTLVDLKQAQQQLVQSEKMASLGELTAGIAHEIQNPLNFVNNFSEVSNELIEEMKTELAAGNVQAANELAESIKQNLEKITHHGKRADGIVKGMLQHSRAGSGQKEPTDLNFLCDEYLRLAYHKDRAKDKSFNAKFETDFDPSLPKVNVVPQDIGRVILNLINNAFYAVGEENKRLTQGYVPTVRVSTKRLGDRIEIQVGDNGPGIPASITEKIFQPFFTTKPTGQGTGLGLSLAYDIVTKLHGGELKVETKQGEGCAFVIIIPCTK